jgi:hypothetical protein
MDERYASWVYAVVPEGTGAPPEPGTGVAGEPVRLVGHAGLAAVVGSVSRGEFGEEPLRRRLRDPGLLEGTARDHHRVVIGFFHHAPTVPFRLATVYHDDTGVRDLLERRRPELLATLDSVAGRAEWGAQAYAGAPGPVPAASTGPAGRPGTGYLLHRRAERTSREQARQEALDSARRVHAALGRLAVAARLEPPGAPRPDQPGPVVLNAAYLVDAAARDELVDTARVLADRYPALRLRTTGPWPAYSFVEIGESA